MKTVLVIDGQGGGLGKAIIERLKKQGLPVRILAVGTNSTATGVMLRAGADEAATGENAILYHAADADVIAGGIGIISANAMMGEISPAMAGAVSSAKGLKILLPLNKCSLRVVGLADLTLGQKLDEMAGQIAHEVSPSPAPQA